MNKQRLFLAALLLGLSGWANAGVPIITLDDAGKVDADFYSVLSLNNNFFGIRDNMQMAGAGDNPGRQGPRSIGKASENPLILAGRQFGAGSFSSSASARAVSPAPAVTTVTASALGKRNLEPSYGLMVAVTPSPKTWAIVLLLLGCLIYQARRRRRPFGFEQHKPPAMSVVS